MKSVIVWFRNDLRLHDNGCLNQAMRLVKSKTARYVIPVYCYDPRFFGKDARLKETGLPKTGIHRQRFIAESLLDLRNSLRTIDSDLLIFEGRPEDVFAKLLPPGSTIITQKEVTQEQIDIDNLVKKAGFTLQTVWGLTMHDLGDLLDKKACAKGADFSSWTTMLNTLKEHRIEPRALLPTPKNGDIPFPDTAPHMPQATKAQTPKNKNEKEKQILNEYIDTAGRFEWYWKARVQGPFVYDNDTGERTVYDDKYAYEVDPRGVMGGPDDLGIRGGENVGLNRVTDYLVPKLVNKYKQTRNRMLGADYSSKFSSWLAHGCVSPRLIYHRIREYEKKNRRANEGTTALIQELTWRDFMIFYARTHNPKIFSIDGVIPRKNAVWVSKEAAKPLFQKWIKGETGYPLVDANMRELGSTGFMSSRGRQNVASFLVYNLQVDWRWGAEYFETMLLDHHPCANWGNWHSIAGLRTGQPAKIYDIARQSQTYDLDGRYVRHWITELRCVPDEMVHRPWAWDGRHKLKEDKGGYFAVEPMASAVEIATNRKKSGVSRSLTVEDWPITALEEKFYPHQPIIQLKNLCGGYAPLDQPCVFTPQTRLELKTRIDSCLNEALMELHSHTATRTHVADTAAAKPVRVIHLASMPVAMSGATPMITLLHAPTNASGTTPHSTPSPHDTATTNPNTIATATVPKAVTVSDWVSQDSGVALIVLLCAVCVVAIITLTSIGMFLGKKENVSKESSEGSSHQSSNSESEQNANAS